MSDFRRRYQRGQSMAEYVVVCMAVVMALGISMVRDDSPLRVFFDAISRGYARFTYSISQVL